MEKEILDKTEGVNLGLTLKGVYVFTKAKLETPEHFRLDKLIRKVQELGGDTRPYIQQLHRMCKTEQWRFDNLIPTVAKTMVANNFGNATPSHPMLINYTALGSGTGSPAAGDTQLGTEVYRKQTASYTNFNNVAYITAFYSSTETTGNYKEAGLFSDASGTANSGVLVSRVLLNSPSGITKSSVETLTIDYTITIS